MKKKIYAKYRGTFFDHKGLPFDGKTHLYVDGNKWVITGLTSFNWNTGTILLNTPKFKYRNSLFFMHGLNYWIEIPKNNLHKQVILVGLNNHIHNLKELIKNRPTDQIEKMKIILRRIEKIKSRHFTNSIDFIFRGEEEYRNI